MARVQIILETPALVRVGLPIVTIASYDILRELDAAGSWALEFPASEALASQVRARWRVSVVEEGRPGYLLYRGIVTDRQYDVDRSGAVVLRMAGFTRLFGLNNESTHQGLSYASTSILGIASALAGEAVIAPTIADVATRMPTVTFDDTTKLSALLTALEYARCSIRETFDEDTFELTAWDNVPDSGFRFVTVEQAGPELDSAAANGMGLIAGRPRIGYNGRDLATRVVPIGTDFDGSPLTLAYSMIHAPYAIQVGTNPDGSNYFYLEDAAAVARSEMIELPLVRSDIKNPNDDPFSRAQAATALYAIAAGTLIQRKNEVLAFACEIANGAQVDALPGDRARVQFRGRAASFGGAANYWSLDRAFLIVKRRDTSTAGGVRGVSFTLTTPDPPLARPTLPTEYIIPPPPSEPPDPPEPTSGDPKEEENGDALPVEDLPVDTGGVPDVGMPPDLPIDKLVPPKRDRGAYQNCCPDPTTNTPGPVTPPPEDVDPDIVTPPDGLFWESMVGPIDETNFAQWVGVCSTTNISPGGTNVEFHELGEVSLTHGGSLDDSPGKVIKVWSIRVTGPAPTLTGVGSQRWVKANASLVGHSVDFQMVYDVAEDSYPFPAGDVFPLTINLATPALPDNKACGMIFISNQSIFNEEPGFIANGGYVEMPGTGGIGPYSVTPYSETRYWSPDNTPFLPRVCMWQYAVEVCARITS